jgi:hypothetical protein
MRSSIYVVAIALIAAAGFIVGSPWLIVLAAVLALPASIVAMPGYYFIYGLLALVPGANPASGSGSQVVAPDGTVISSSVTGQPATWFTIATAAIGVLALTIAACLNVLAVRALVAHRQGQSVKSH